MFTPQELQNIVFLIKKTPITGEEATTVALLMNKIAGMLKPPSPMPEKNAGKTGDSTIPPKKK